MSEETKAPDLNALTKEWIKRFELCVRRRAYDSLFKLFHENLVLFGLETNICATLQQAIDREFKEIWPRQLAFTVDLSRLRVVPDAQSVLAVAPWTAQSVIKGAPPKNGRMTIVLGIFDGGKMLALHLHSSINPTVRITP